jgi:hypothetical protein
MDSALVQTLVAGILVLAAALFLGRRAWHSVVTSRRAPVGGASCAADGGCGCAERTHPSELESVTPPTPT